MDKALWTPNDAHVRESHMRAFMDAVEDDWNVTVDDWQALYRFSIEQPEKFWVSLKDYACIPAATWGEDVLVDADKMPGARWFPGARLNYAESLLQRRDDAQAIVFSGEDRVHKSLTWTQLYDRVSRVAQLFESLGLGEGERIAAVLPNLPDAVVCMLAATSLGAVWSSCSPDFGVQGIKDRFSQIEPKILLVSDGYFYNGKTHGCLDKVREALAHLPSVAHVLVVDYALPEADTTDIGIRLEAAIAPFAAREIDFRRVAFDHPLFILFSSGTTGVPKCIVHGHGGTLLQHRKEHLLHCDIKACDRVFYFTTLGWMMWNWLVSALAAQATIVLYDGAPFHPGPEALFDLIDRYAITFFGTSAKSIDAVKKSGLVPRHSHDLGMLRTIASTGSPLMAESFDFVYRDIKADVHLASISGGTDIISCFMLGDPTRPVWRGEVQGPGLGMAIDVFDDDERPTLEKGELVCTKPFPCMPVGFWNDPSGEKYRSAYFDKIPGVWTHGDWVQKTEHGGYVIFGRSDATLNPGGVRIGTAEIYRVVEQLDAVTESIVVGQAWEGDVRVVLFVRLNDNLALDDALIATIKKRIRAGCSPRHVPAKVVQVADIPRTKSGKITELAVRDVIHGRTVKNVEALANPEALALYQNLGELRT